MQDIQPWYE